MKKRLLNGCIAALLALGVASASQAAGVPVAGASGDDLNGLNQSFGAWLDGGTYTLYDPSYLVLSGTEELSTGIEASGETVIYADASGDGSVLDYVTSTTLTSGWDPAAVSVISNIYQTLNYFQTTFGRNGIDDANMNNLAIIGLGDQSSTAFWNGSFMVFGDGDGVVATSLAGCLDVVASLLSRGVVDHSANFRYGHQGGALTIAFGEIFAAMVDDNDWTIGEDCTLADPGYLRSLALPNRGYEKRATHMDEYQSLPIGVEQGWVIYNSGIPVRAAFLLAEGLTNEGSGSSIGRAKTAQIFYRALTQYLLRPAQFIDARRTTIQAAEDLYGAASAEVTAVGLAWDEVGVVEGSAVPDSTAPTTVDAIEGDDVLVYLRSAAGGHTLHMQTLANPFTGYDALTDQPLVHSQLAKAQRPVLVTTATGSGETATYQHYVYFIGMDNNIYLLDINRSTQIQLTASGDVMSIAVSPDNHILAYVNGSELDTVNLVNLNANIAITRKVLPSALNSEAEVGSMAFDFSSNKLVLEVAYCQSLPGDSCPAGGYQYHGVKVLDIDSGEIDDPMPDQPVNVEIANPSFASNTNHILVMDMIDKRSFASDGMISSKVVSYNTLAVGAAKQQTVWAFPAGPTAIEGVPSFWGDDNYVSFQKEDLSAYRVSLNSDWSGDSGSIVRLNNFETLQPAMYRNRVRDVTPSVQLSETDLRFGEILVGQSADLSLQITNNGPVDVEIETITIADDTGAFSHSGGYTFLPRNKSITIGLGYQATSNLLTDVGTLSINLRGGESVEASLQADVVEAARLFTDLSVLEYGEVEFGTSKNLQLVITNEGTQAATIAKITASNSAFSFDTVLESVPGATTADGVGRRVVNVSYTAANTEQTDIGSLVIEYTGEKSISVGLNGRSVPAPVPAQLQADLTELAFGQVGAWSVKTLSVTISNTGELGATIIEDIVSNGQFFYVLDENQIAGQGELKLDITYAADDVAGPQSGMLVLAYGDGRELVISLSAETLPAPAREEQDRGGIASTSLVALLLMMLAMLRRRRGFKFSGLD